MAYIIRDEELYRLSIFVILFPDDNAFFVWKTPEGNLKKAYKTHYYCESKKTKYLFEKARKENTLPPMYCLETVEKTHEDAFLHCIAWAKYFMEQGLTSYCGIFLDKYTVDLGKESAAIFDTIKDKKLEDVCPVGQDLFPKFGREKVQNEQPKNNAISLRVTPDEYKKIKNAAGDAQITVSEFCKKMALNGRVIHVDQEVFNILSSYVNAFVQRDQLLKAIMAAIFSTRTYFPADLDVVQEAVTENAEQQRKAMEEVKQLLQLLH